MKFTHILLLALVCLAIVQPGAPWKKFRRRIENALKKLKVCTGPVCVERGKRSVQLDLSLPLMSPQRCGIEVTNLTGIIANLRESDTLDYVLDETIVDDDVNGTFSSNGTIQGLSGISFNASLDSLILDHFGYHSVFLNFTTENPISVTGFYEIQNGTTDVEGIGKHTFSGVGTFNATISGFGIQLLGSARSFPRGLGIRPERNVARVREIEFNIAQANITAENFEVDGMLVDWVKVNEEMMPFIDTIHDVIAAEFVEELNELLQGCNFWDIKRILGTYRRRG